MFRLPQLPKTAMSSSKHLVKYKGIPCFEWDKFGMASLIGAGSYGQVFRGVYDKEQVVVKLLGEADEDDMVKEARIHHQLKHKNLVEFKSISPARKAIMLEYLYFDMKMFGGERNVSSLDALLPELHKGKCIGFEHLIHSIATQIVSGLAYLHEKGVAHRDLKPGNVLVSNQHLLKLTSVQQRLEWISNPCVAKLTDFGESWGNLAKSSAAACSYTENVYKGTPAFMAPEVINTTGRPTQINESELKRADIWSLGMLLFCLINPGCKIPFQLEAKNHAVQQGQWQQYFKRMISSNVKPTQDPNYDGLRATAWVYVEEAFQKCTVKGAALRPSLSDVSKLLNEYDKSESYPLSNHQGTALENAHDNYVRQSEVGTSEEEFIAPSNDGTNACVFLALKICEDALKKEPCIGNWENLKSRCEKIINANNRHLGPSSKIKVEHY